MLKSNKNTVVNFTSFLEGRTTGLLGSKISCNVDDKNLGEYVKRTYYMPPSFEGMYAPYIVSLTNKSTDEVTIIESGTYTYSNGSLSYKIQFKK
jgi:hypothetical protein